MSFAFAILSNALATVTVEPATGHGATGKHRVTGGSIAVRPGRLIVLGTGPWQATEAEAWEHEARRLDALATRRAREATRLCGEVEALEGQARRAMERARDATRAGGAG